MRTALVLSGTGVLAGCADRLVERGWRVVLPSRRQPPLTGDARTIWVRADWAEPARLASEVEYELAGNPVNLLVAWVHNSYRVSVLTAVRHLLAEGAPVVEVHTCAPVPDPVLPHPTQQVLLGHFAHDATPRTNRAVLEAVERGLEGRAPSLHHEDAR